MSNTTKSTRTFYPTQAYFDTAGEFTIVTSNNTTVLRTAIPQDVLDSDREAQEAWVTEVAREAGRKVRGRSKDYPYGFHFNVSNPPR